MGRSNRCIWTLLAAALLLAPAAPARAERFFPELQTLFPGSFLELSYGDRREQNDTAFLGAYSSRLRDTTRRGTLNLRFKQFGIGATGYGDEFELNTDTFRRLEQEHGNAVFAAGFLRNLLLDDDVLTLTVSSGSSVTDFAFQLPLPTLAYSRRETFDNDGRVGIMYKFSVFVVGYAQGGQRAAVEIVDSSFPPIAESYAFDTAVQLAGVILEGKGSGAHLIWERMGSPGKPGKVVDLDPGFSEHWQATWRLGAFGVSWESTQSRSGYHGVHYRTATRAGVSLAYAFSHAFTLSLSQTQAQREVGFVFLGQPLVSHTLGELTQMGLRWEF
jgi:hypothetical protein